MISPDNEFLDELQATFRVEAAEHLHTIASGLLELEKESAAEARLAAIETVFRAAHNLKGAARAVDFTGIEAQCQALEDVFAAWKRGTSEPSPAMLDRLHQTLNAITDAMSAGVPAADAPAAAFPVVPGERAGVADDTVPLAGEDSLPPVLVPERKATAVEGTVRISVAKLDAQLVKAEELLTAKLTTARRAAELRELTYRFEGWRREWATVEPEARALRQATERSAGGRKDRPSAGLARLLDFCDWNLDYVRSLESRLAALTRTAEQNRNVIGKLVDDLLEDSKTLLLLPFATLATQFPRLVRDICRDQGKEAELVIRGEWVEIDKRILEEMKDPLIHLLRNCVDHGIERPEVRSSLGKPGRATITVDVSQVNGSKVQILVSDDGTGIDTGKVRETAVSRGLLPAEEARDLGEEEAAALIFQPEVSTSPIITRLSGRGLGLAIVREKAEKLGGTVAVESRPRAGTTFRIVLPSLLATFRGILIEAGGRQFVVPTTHVERVARVNADDMRTVEGRETISLAGRVMSRVHMTDVLELPRSRNSEPSAAVSVVVLGAGEHRIAFEVDAVLDEQEVLVKRLGKPLLRVRNIAGATVLGSGQVVPILNVADLLKSAHRTSGAAARVAAPVKPAEAITVLVADDSITSRMLIKGILESAGFEVETAVDGTDALTLLRTKHFDLLVSDVEMPRMNGFDLTARIRADRKLAELPVVLVTALETREDRERGIDAGANAYIIKSSFDQSDLLDAIRRLV